MAKEKNALSEKCPSCNAPLKYNSKEDKFECEYCKGTYTLFELEEYKKSLNKEKEKESKEEIFWRTERNRSNIRNREESL